MELNYYKLLQISFIYDIEYRLVGEYRLQKYAMFLMERYFPIHDQQSLVDGELMYQYAIGNAAKTEVENAGKRADFLLNKYICLSKNIK